MKFLNRIPAIFSKDFWVLNYLHWKAGRHFIFAHHPLCKKYRNEYWKLGKYCFCRGCTGVYSGILVSIPFSIFIFQHFTGLSMLIFQLCLIPLTFIFQIFKPPRLVKDFIRFSLGFAIGSLVLWILLSSAIFCIKLIALVCLILLWYIFRLFRLKLSHSFCPNCTEYESTENGHVCSGMKYQYRRMLAFSKVASKYQLKRRKENI